MPFFSEVTKEDIWDFVGLIVVIFTLLLGVFVLSTTNFHGLITELFK